MNRLYRLYFYLRFWAAQASKKFFEFLLGDFTKYDTDVKSYPMIDTSHIYDIIAEQDIDLINAQSQNLEFTFLNPIKFEIDPFILKEPTILDYNFDFMSEFDINPNINISGSNQTDYTDDTFSGFEVSMIATRIANLNDYSSSGNTLNSMSVKNMTELEYYR